MPQTYDVIVIGVGAMGSSCCLHLAKRGLRVLGLEAHGIPNTVGSSHGDTRMIRLCYYEHPDYVPLLRRAYELWNDLERETGAKLLEVTGGVYMGLAGSGFLEGTLRSAREHDLPHEALTHKQVRERFSQFTLPNDYEAVFEPSAGFLYPERVISATATLAKQHGAELREHATVKSWEANSGSVGVRTNSETFTARHLVVCGGAWTNELLGDIGVKLTVTRQPLLWFKPKHDEAFSLGRLPVWAIDHPDGSQHYGFPVVQGLRPGLKISHHYHGTATTADQLDRSLRAEDEADVRGVVERFLPDANGPLLASTICMYTCTPDSHFVIDRHPSHGNVTIACGFSGHGFKFASVMGEVLADLAESGETRHPVGFLRLKRFR